MAKYVEFWQKLLYEINAALDTSEPLEKTFRESGIEKIGNRKSYSGSLEVFGMEVRNHSDSQVFRDLAEAIEKNKSLKAKLAGQLKVKIDKFLLISFSYKPFSWELMMNHYRDYQDKTQMAAELYKWELVQKFQERWHKYKSGEIEFKEFMKGIEWGNLVYHMFPPNLNGLIEGKPKELEAALLKLFDLGLDLQERVDAFRNELEGLYNEIKDKPKDKLFLAEREIATLLTFRYPQHFTFFIPSFYTPLLKALERKNPPKWQQLADYHDLVNQFKDDVLPKYDDAIAIKNRFTHGDKYYPDHDNLLLIQDIFYISFMKGKTVPSGEKDTIEANSPARYWLYAPGENASRWVEFYSSKTMGLGWDKLGNLDQYESKEEIAQKLRQAYSGSTSKSNDAFANWQFANDLTPGDFVIAKTGRNKLLGLGQIISDYYWDEEQKDFKNRRGVKWTKKGNWKTDHSLALKTLTDITDYETEDPRFDKYFEKLLHLMDNSQEKGLKNMSKAINKILYGPPGTGKTYSTKAYAVSLAKHGHLMDQERLNLSQHRAECLQNFESLKAEGRIEFVTFHQSFSYEDFVQGIRPDVSQKELAFDLVDGIFKVLCDRARKNYEAASSERLPTPGFEEVFEAFMSDLMQDEVQEIKVEMRRSSFAITGYDPSYGSIHFRKQSGGTEHDLLKKNLRSIYDGKLNYRTDGLGIYYHPLVERLKEFGKKEFATKKPEPLKNYVLIIDEINRANISRVLGELITLLEPDKRLGGDDELIVKLPSGEDFAVPPNLHIIGTMNTADKSIAHLDVALRRRFKFVPKYPEHYRASDNEKAEFLRKLNNYIAENYNADLTIGHSYFMDGKESIMDIMENKVMPLLNEYFNQQYDEIKEMLEKCGLAVQKKENGFGMLECTGYKSAGDGEST